MRLLLHVGPHKTGTTTLQYAFDALRYVLLGAGIYYPRGLHSSGAHHALAWQFLGRPLDWLGVAPERVSPPEQRLNRWVSEANELDCHTLLLSAEDFSLFGSETWNQLQNIEPLADKINRTEVVWVRRSPTEMARSAYGTLVMFGESRRFAEIESALVTRFEINQAALADHCDDEEGIAAWRALDFDSLAISNRFVHEFCSTALDIPLPDTEWPSLNVGLSTERIELVRQWNRENCPQITIDDNTGDFPPEVFLEEANLIQRRIEFLNTLAVA